MIPEVLTIVASILERGPEVLMLIHLALMVWIMFANLSVSVRRVRDAGGWPWFSVLTFGLFSARSCR